MVNFISYLVPFLGLAVCLFVIFTRKINTRCPIRISKMCLWVVAWTIVLFYDYPYESQKAIAIMVFRLILLVLNILYIVEASLYARRLVSIDK